MKPISRFLSFMLAVLTLFTALPVLALPAAAEDYPTLLPGDAITITDETEFQFIPTESGTYRFYSTDSDGDPYGYLYDAGHNLIISDDDGNGNRNFKIEYDLTAGETYYLKASFWNGDSGSYTVCLEFIGIAGDGWSLVDGVLTISADFVMGDYSFDDPPWYSYWNIITSVVLEDGVTSIGDYAFYDCTSLTSVTIPGSVTTIGEAAFGYCLSLTSVTIPGSVTSIGSSAFYYCTSLTSVTIPSSVTTIDDYAFCGCRSLTSVTIPGSVTTIGVFAFCGCDSFTSVTIPDGVTTIGDCAFSGCDSLTSVTIPGSVTTISSFAFEKCVSLTSVTIPDGVTTIGDHAFTECDSLGNIYCEAESQPEGWDECWLDGCDATVHWGEKPASAGECGENLTYTLNSNGRLQIDGTGAMTNWSSSSSTPWYSNRDKIKTVVIGSGVTSIGDYAFASCTSLTSVTIPNSVTSIGEYAFDYCTSLTSVTIPNSVTRIYWYAFYDCSSLTDIFCEATEQPAGWFVAWLAGCNATVHWGSTGPDEPELVTGDLNEDGTLSILDVTKLLIWIKEASVTPERLTMGDLNEDGTLSILDVTALLRMLSEQ